MKEKSSKQAKKSNPTVQLKDLKPTKDSKGQGIRGREILGRPRRPGVHGGYA